MMENWSPPSQVPWLWCRIVRACKVLTGMEKLVYDEQRGLSKRRGATIGAGPLGLRLGTSRETVERARRRLVKHGMLHKLDLGRGKTAAWFPDLPEGCHPPRHVKRLCDDDVQAFADALAARITRQNHGESGVGEDATQGA